MKKKNVWRVLLTISLLSIGVYLYSISSYFNAHGYAYAYNKKDFEKVFSYYNQEAIEKKFKKEEILEFLQEQSQIRDKIKARELTMIKDQTTNKWFVKFPYTLYNISISTPIGATVYIDNKKIVEIMSGRGVEIRDMLPGKYQVAIEYYDQMYPTFVKEISVPEEIKVDSPYNTQDIAVFAPPGTWVTIGGITKHNQGQKVLFENMLTGQYDLSLLTDDKEVEVFSQKTQIDNQNSNIHIEKIKGNETIKKDLEEFFQKFNKAYKQGIINKDPLFLHKFAVDPINEDLMTDFKMWYIDNKDVQDAKSLMEIRDIYPISGNQLKVSVLETVYLNNIDRDYRVVIEWNYKLLRNNSSWQITSRDILQSIVAYKNEEGNWVKY